MIKDGTSQQLLLASGETADVGDFLPKQFPHAMGQMIIEPNDDIRNQGLRIMKNKNNWDSFVLSGCNTDPTDTDGPLMLFYHFQLNPRYNDWRQQERQNEGLMALSYTLLIAIDRRMILDQFAVVSFYKNQITILVYEGHLSEAK
ncbi:MAG: hypothetical protein EZS28_033210 [Streblomastix strix]|uniref:Uncharacterized protein n=1 Tax=Streblomastix strix TaxID=222440 RepID=A0A5J4UM11_9EUKA|nr:MAG: hypothetical protein EZS28_033210 [Streblomastix strix]